jgi:N-acetylmuramoyl-L-alanine amidase
MSPTTRLSSASTRARSLALALVWAVATLGGCAAYRPATTPGGVPIVVHDNALGQDSRVLFLVIHYTVANLPLSMKILRDGGQVSAHYLVSDESPPRIHRLVPEERRAWHSGPSHWRGHSMLNANSIGIEIVHPGFRDTPQGREWPPYPSEQVEAVVTLVKDVVRRHGIRPERIVGHSDVLPQHKQDPGPAFPWKRLADEGLIPWPDAGRVEVYRASYEAQLPDVAWFQRALRTHGFEVPQHGELDAATRNVLVAFQMRHRPLRFDGVPDAETAALLHVLTAPRPVPR